MIGRNPKITSPTPWRVDDEFLIRDANGEIVADVSSKAYGGPHKDQRQRVADAYAIAESVNLINDLSIKIRALKDELEAEKTQPFVRDVYEAYRQILDKLEKIR